MRLDIKNISKSFGDKRVLRDVSLSAHSGAAFGLLGRNGAGKTTTIRILMNVFQADSGEVLLDGRRIGDCDVRIGYLPEERGLYPKKTVIDQLVYFAELKGMNRRDARYAADQWLDRLGMTEYRGKRLDTLSKGNQQKIQLITAVIHDPQVVVLDEPFSGLDPVNATLLKDVVREETERNKIVLFSSHQMNYIEEFCDEIMILNSGKAVLSGNLRSIKRSYPRDRLNIQSPDTPRILQRYGDRAERIDEERLLLRLRDESEKRTVMSQLPEQYDIDQIGVFEPTLNDIFVEYTGRSI